MSLKVQQPPTNHITNHRNSISTTPGCSDKDTHEKVFTIWERASCSFMNIKNSWAHFKIACSYAYFTVTSNLSTAYEKIKNVFAKNVEQIDEEIIARDKSMNNEIDAYFANIADKEFSESQSEGLEELGFELEVEDEDPKDEEELINLGYQVQEDANQVDLLSQMLSRSLE